MKQKSKTKITKRAWMGGFLLGILVNGLVISFLALPSFTSAPIRRRHLEEAQQDDYREEELVESTFVVCIVLFLLFLTIGFEWLKEHLEHAVTEDLEPVIEKLFGEMTVLGFLSMVTFILNEAGFFRFLSFKIYGENEDGEELLEVFEVVHFAIFFVMVFFFVQVVVLIRQAMWMEEQWHKMDREKMNDVPVTFKSRVYSGCWTKLRHSNSFLALFPFFRNLGDEAKLARTYFYILRQEFILDRSLEYPFLPAPESQQVNQDFNFGRYLGFCLVNFLTHIVEVKNTTLLFFAFASLVAYGYILLVQEDMWIVAWSWLVLEWVVFIFHIFFEQHVAKIQSYYIPRRNPISNEESVDAKDNTIPFQSMEDYNNSVYEEALPGWCHVDLDHYVNGGGRSWIAKTLVGGSPNRQETLFWMDRGGPNLYLLMIQSNLIFIGLDCAIQLMFCLPLVWDQASSKGLFWVYAVLATLSIAGSIGNKKYLITTLSVVCSIGYHRNLQAVESVYREEKVENLVRMFLVVYRLQRLTHMDSSEASTSETTKHYTDVLDSFEIAQVTKIFQAFDSGGRGAISADDFLQCRRLSTGSPVTMSQAQRIIATMDIDKGGDVGLEEFLQWYADNSSDHEDILRVAPHEIFKLIDKDGNGEVSVACFKEKLDTLQLDFTMDEQLAIINELDRDSSGKISEHEFEQLFSKFNPKKLRQSEQDYFFEMLPGCGGACGTSLDHVVT